MTSSHLARPRRGAARAAHLLSSIAAACPPTGERKMPLVVVLGGVVLDWYAREQHTRPCGGIGGRRQQVPL
ncbi:hypothetical protein QYE76_009557 [Lolium multiflorum]|uniref:Uncharacterized protein n=1 Tax=Lolium multiflorum TaxID=4521 RepID=A0AAD8TS52_LOLMU|nr:hypothetical protein QYE76_009557 [Lolium multiflorum]